MKRVREGEYVYVFLQMYEYGTLKSVEVILRRRGRGRIMEGMNQTGAQRMNMWKCYSETPCTTTIYK
jgi:hypothetical protein